MKLPGPDHPITITANPKRVRVSAGGVVIADTTHALTLKEASYPAVQYVPREDANMALLARTERTTHCPYKGDANYFSINADGKSWKIRSGPMRRHSRRWPRSPAIWRSIRTRSRSRKWRSRPRPGCAGSGAQRRSVHSALLNRVPGCNI